VVGRPSATVGRVGAAPLVLLAVVSCLDAIRFIGRLWSGFGTLPDGSVAPLTLSLLRLPEAPAAGLRGPASAIPV